MSKFNKSVNNFTLGEISPRALGRIDLDEYSSSCKYMQRFTPLKNGGAAKLSGTEYVKRLGTVANLANVALIPFETADASYQIMITPNDYNNTRFTVFKVTTVGAPTVGVCNNTSDLYYPKTGIDTKQFQYAQAGDVMFITHLSGLWPTTMVTYFAGNFQFTDHNQVWGYAMPPEIKGLDTTRMAFRPANTTTTTITPSGTSIGILTASSGIFDPGHVGYYFKLTHGSTTGIAKITSYSNPAIVHFSVINGFTLGATTATTNWEECAWSTYRGFPKTVAFYEQSLYLGGSPSQPGTLWKSRTGDVVFFMESKFIQDTIGTPATDVTGLNYFGDATTSDPASFTIASHERNDIVSLSALRQLNVLTNHTEYVAYGKNTILSNDDVTISPQTNYGAHTAMAVRRNNETVFIRRDKLQVRNFKYSDSNGSNISQDLTLMADHLYTEGGNSWGFSQIVYHKSRDTFWLLNENEKLLACTYLPEAKVLGWSKHDIASVEDIHHLSVSRAPDKSEALYIVVERDVDGTNEFVLERILPDFDGTSYASFSSTGPNRGAYLDSHVAYNLSGSGTVIPGLDHLEGKEVAVIVQGRYIGDYTVSGGEVDLGDPVSTFSRYTITGLKYSAEIQTSDIEAGGDFGTAQGAIQRIDRVTAKVHKTFDLQIGQTDGNGIMEAVPFIDSDPTSGLVPESKDYRVNGSFGPDGQQSVRLLSEEPYPCTILSLALRGVTHD